MAHASDPRERELSKPAPAAVLRTISSKAAASTRKWSDEEDMQAAASIAGFVKQRFPSPFEPENHGSMAQLLLDLSTTTTNWSLSATPPQQPAPIPQEDVSDCDTPDQSLTTAALPSTVTSKKRTRETPAAGGHRKHKSVGSAGRWTVEEDTVLRLAVEAAGE